MNTDKYYESHIKCDFLNFLRAGKIINSRTLIASEYVLGTTGRRADLAVLNGSNFIGIEVKSQYDTLARLHDQLNVYIACFDEVIIVLDQRHVEEGLAIAPAEVGVFEVGRKGEISLRRAAETKPQVVSETYMQLLTMQELKRLMGYSVSSPIKRSLLLAQAATLPEDLIRSAVTGAFRQAFSSTSEEFWRKVKRRRVTPDALGFLSRFAPDRVNLREKQDQWVRFWDAWQRDAFIALQDPLPRDRSTQPL